MYTLSKALIIACGSAAALACIPAQAADTGDVRVTFDPGFTDRTNMGRAPGDSSSVGVSVDAGLQARTNMPVREQKEAGSLVAKPDMGLRERTNMGGIGRAGTAPDTPETAAVTR